MKKKTMVAAAVSAMGMAFAVEPNAAMKARLEADEDIIGIVHWGLNTYTDQEWGYGDVDPGRLDPDAFDADQIVGAAAAGGIRGLVIVAKHHDGFCLWPTKTTDYNISKSPFRGGKGDYVREMEQACRKAGIRFGVYCSPWDRNNADYANAKYVETYHAQIRELLDGRYGEVFEMWFDGANGGDGYYGGAKGTRTIPEGYYRFGEVFGFVRKLQPMVTIFGMGGEWKWPHNELGFCDPKTTPSDDKVFRMWECDFPLRPGWFYHASQDGKTKSGLYLMNRYLNSVGNGGTMDIGLAPDRHGRLAAEDVRSLADFGRIRKMFFSRRVEIKAGAKYNVALEKRDHRKYVTATTNELWTLNLGENRRDAKYYLVDPELLHAALSATTETGETDTAKWMKAAERK